MGRVRAATREGDSFGTLDMGVGTAGLVSLPVTTLSSILFILFSASSAVGLFARSTVIQYHSAGITGDS